MRSKTILIAVMAMAACESDLPLQPDSAGSEPAFARVGAKRAKEMIVYTWRPDATEYFDVWGMDPDGTNMRNLSDFAGANEVDPEISPDGTQIAFSSGRDGVREIYVMDVDGSNKQRRTWSGTGSRHPTWSPDGSQIAFQRWETDRYQIWVMDADGGNPVNISNNSATEWYPDWSPDGSLIAYQSDFDGTTQIYVMTPDGVRGTRLTNAYPDNSQPRWSPDGDEIVFTSTRDDLHGDIWVMDSQGTNQRRLTTNPRHDFDPDWSPKGNQIVFVRNESPTGLLHEIAVMSVQGAAFGLKYVTSHLAEDMQPHWGVLAPAGG